MIADPTRLHYKRNRMNPKDKYLEIQKAALLGQLERLLSRLENPQLTREQLDSIKQEALDCQKRLQELGFAQDKVPSQDAEG